MTDLIDDLVRTSRPTAPMSLGPAVASRLDARRRTRVAVMASSFVLVATGVLIIALPRAESTREVSSHGVMPAAPSCGTGCTTPPVVPIDAYSARVPSWDDTPALLADLEQTHRRALAECVARATGPNMWLGGGDAKVATFQVRRDDTGSTRVEFEIGHSIGYVGYTEEERCLAKLGQVIVVPPLPDVLTSVRFSFGKTSVPSPSWRDPARVGMDLIAPVRAELQACFHGQPSFVTISFERAYKSTSPRTEHVAVVARARFTFDSSASVAVRKCVLALADEIAVPTLPAPLDQVVIAIHL